MELNTSTGRTDFFLRGNFLKLEINGSELSRSLCIRSVFVTTGDIFLVLSHLNCLTNLLQDSAASSESSPIDNKE